jgi:hypothetical protein
LTLTGNISITEQATLANKILSGVESIGSFVGNFFGGIIDSIHNIFSVDHNILAGIRDFFGNIWGWFSAIGAFYEGGTLNNNVYEFRNRLKRCA